MAASAGSDDQLVLPIIDAHVHLFPASELSSLRVGPPDGPFDSQRSVDEYRAAVGPPAASASSSLLGFVFVETDRVNDLDAVRADADDASLAAAAWAEPLNEIRWLRRIATGQPRPGEGHAPEDRRLCLGIVPWAPVACGADILARYLAEAERVAGEATWAKVKGFRFLLQDKPAGTMVSDDFVAALKLLGRRRFVFDVGVDHHRRGKKQLDETLEMVGRAHEGVPDHEKVTFVLDHMCKPDLSVYNTTSDPTFHAWRTAIYALSKSPNVYVKLSGLFSELPESLRTAPATRIFEAALPWLGVLLATFGPDRIIFGSDWPVCALGLPDAWPRWKEVVDKTCWMASLTDDERAMILGGAAKKAYRL